MPYIFTDDGAPEASDYDSNYVFVDEEALRQSKPARCNTFWRRIAGWWRLCPSDSARRH